MACAGPTRMPLCSQALMSRLAEVDSNERVAAFQELRSALAPLQSVSVDGESNDSDSPDGELLNIWKALFYCYWHCDKRQTQLELGQQISDLTVSLPCQTAIRFCNAFWRTLIREWTRIDSQRIDKFYLLIRFMHYSAIKSLELSDWCEQAIDKYTDMFLDGLLCPSAQEVPDSLRMHTIEIFVPVLAGSTTCPVPEGILTLMILPFVAMMAKSKNMLLIHKIHQNVFLELTKISIRAAIANGGSANTMNTIDTQEEMPDDVDLATVCNPIVCENLNIDFPEILDFVFQFTRDAEIRPANRRRLYGLVKDISRRLRIPQPHLQLREAQVSTPICDNESDGTLQEAQTQQKPKKLKLKLKSNHQDSQKKLQGKKQKRQSMERENAQADHFLEDEPTPTLVTMDLDCSNDLDAICAFSCSPISNTATGSENPATILHTEDAGPSTHTAVVGTRRPDLIQENAMPTAQSFIDLEFFSETDEAPATVEQRTPTRSSIASAPRTPSDTPQVKKSVSWSLERNEVKRFVKQEPSQKVSLTTAAPEKSLLIRLGSKSSKKFMIKNRLSQKLPQQGSKKRAGYVKLKLV